jgi:hypothetical protein
MPNPIPAPVPLGPLEDAISALDATRATRDELAALDAKAATKAALADLAHETDVSLSALSGRVGEVETGKAAASDLADLADVVATKAAQADHEALAARVSDVERDKADASDLDALSAVVATKAAQAEVTALAGRVSAVETGKADVSSVTALTGRVSTLETGAATLAGRVTAVETGKAAAVDLSLMGARLDAIWAFIQQGNPFVLPLRTSLVGSDGRVATFTRPSKAWYEGADGLIHEVAEGMPRLRADRGVLIEEARTNRLLWSRDLTNAAWGTKVDVAVERVVDGSALGGFVNRVTSLAGGNTARFYQAIGNLANTVRVGSMRVRHVAGPLSVEVMDPNNTAWGVTVPLVAGAWTWVERVGTGATAFACSGLRFAEAGAIVDVDWCQVEDGTFPTSPIWTEGTPLARAADVLTVSTAGWPVGAGRVAIRFAPVWSGTPPATASLLDARSGIPGDGFAWYLAADGSQRFNFRRAADSATADSASIAQTYIAATRVSAGWTSAGALFTRDSAPVAHIGSPTGLALAALVATARVGCSFIGGAFANAWLSDLEVSHV